MSLQEEIDDQRNVFGEMIETCSNRPMTGLRTSYATSSPPTGIWARTLSTSVSSDTPNVGSEVLWRF